MNSLVIEARIIDGVIMVPAGAIVIYAHFVPPKWTGTSEDHHASCASVALSKL